MGWFGGTGAGRRCWGGVWLGGHGPLEQLLGTVAHGTAPGCHRHPPRGWPGWWPSTDFPQGGGHGCPSLPPRCPPRSLLTRPGLQQVVQHLDVPLEIDGAGDVLAVGVAAGACAAAPRLLALGEQDGTEADGDVLRVHAVEVVEGGHQAEVVQEPRQRGLGDRVASAGTPSQVTFPCPWATEGKCFGHRQSPMSPGLNPTANNEDVEKKCLAAGEVETPKNAQGGGDTRTCHIAGATHPEIRTPQW